MDRSMAVSVASALVSSQFDYANSVLFGCPQKHTARLQRAQHALASALDFLQWHLLNFLNSSTGSPLNGVSGLNLPP